MVAVDLKSVLIMWDGWMEMSLNSVWIFCPHAFCLFYHDLLNLRGGFSWGLLGHETRANSPDEYFVIGGMIEFKGLLGVRRASRVFPIRMLLFPFRYN